MEAEESSGFSTNFILTDSWAYFVADCRVDGVGVQVASQVHTSCHITEVTVEWLGKGKGTYLFNFMVSADPFPDHPSLYVAEIPSTLLSCVGEEPLSATIPDRPLVFHVHVKEKLKNCSAAVEWAWTARHIHKISRCWAWTNNRKHDYHPRLKKNWLWGVTNTTQQESSLLA